MDSIILDIDGTLWDSTELVAEAWNQALAEKTGLSTVTIYKFESGTANNLSLGTFLLLLKAVGWINAINDFMPELPESPYLVRDDEKKVQRIRHKKL